MIDEAITKDNLRIILTNKKHRKTLNPKQNWIEFNLKPIGGSLLLAPTPIDKRQIPPTQF